MIVPRNLTSKQQRNNSAQIAQTRSGMKPTHISLITWHIAAACYYFYWTSMVCGAETTGMKLLDLSHTFDENTLYWVTAKKLNLTITHNGTDPTGTYCGYIGKGSNDYALLPSLNKGGGASPDAPNDYLKVLRACQDAARVDRVNLFEKYLLHSYMYQADEISAGTHGGTHMDSPCHFAVGRWCVSDIPLDRLVVPAVVVDISHDVQDNPKVHLTPDHLTDWEKRHGLIPDGSLLLVRTGWARYWPNPLRYTGTEERNVNLLKFPSITPEAAKWLVQNRNIAGIGIDTMSIDNPTGTKGVHTTLLDKNIYGLENVNLVDPLPPKGMTAYVMPMKLRGASGAPCRVFLEVKKDAMTNGNIGSSNSVSLIWTTSLLAAVAWTLS